jgi:MarR family transcriptional regulator, lower aerobic nicotinate degradation pathway regulator
MLAWVAHLAGEVYAQGLAPLGIKPQHLGILTLLESEGPMVQARLSDRLTIVKPVVVGLINELEARRFVERRPHPTDRRAFEIHLLDQGRQCIRDAEAVSRAATASFFGALSPEEQQTLYQLLSQLASSNSGRTASSSTEKTS